jgi:transmembrane 9 superfamily member 3
MELVKSLIKIQYLKNMEKEIICTKKMSKENILHFKLAIENQYYYQFYVDDLPMLAMVGGIEESTKEIYLYTHQKIQLGYNKDQILEANLTAENPRILNDKEENFDIEFTYSVEFINTPHIEFSQRFKRYLDDNFFEHKIHWFFFFFFLY